MSKHKIDVILNKVASTLDYPPEVIGSVVTHAFKYMHDYMKNPTHAGLRYQHLGVIRASKKALNHYLRALIARLREDRNNEQLKERFRAY